MKNIFLLIILATTILIAEKYAIIYAELPETIQIKTKSEKYDPQLMEKTWKAVFLKWEELVCKEGIKMKNIQILYCEGIDYTHYIYAISLSRRYMPEYVSGMPDQKIVAGRSTREEFDTTINKIKQKMRSDDSLFIFEYEHLSGEMNAKVLDQFEARR